MLKETDMKKIIIMALAVLALTGCESAEYNQDLRAERNKLERIINSKNAQLESLNKKISDANQRLNDINKEVSYVQQGRTPKYMICIKLHQSTFTLDPIEHIKNSMNDIEMWVETSKDFYYSVRKGEELSSNFKSGSFWLNGDISNLHITITDKRIK